MDREQIEKWRAESDQYADSHFPAIVIDNPDNEMRRNEIRDDHLARLVWNAAMDKAKAKCIQVSERYMETDFYKHAELQSNAVVGASDCAAAIDELKEPQP